MFITSLLVQITVQKSVKLAVYCQLRLILLITGPVAKAKLSTRNSQPISTNCQISKTHVNCYNLHRVHSNQILQVTNDGKHPLLEFAMRYFRDVEMVQSPNGSVIGGQGGQRKKKSKKTKNNKDWTWRDQINTVKWSDQMINVSSGGRFSDWSTD